MLHDVRSVAPYPAKTMVAMFNEVCASVLKASNTIHAAQGDIREELEKVAMFARITRNLVPNDTYRYQYPRIVCKEESVQKQVKGGDKVAGHVQKKVTREDNVASGEITGSRKLTSSIAMGRTTGKVEKGVGRNKTSNKRKNVNSRTHISQ